MPFLPSQSSSEDELLRHKVFLLLSWSVCWLQYGDHRPYAAASLLRRWRDRAEERASRSDADLPHELLQDLLFDWLDTSENAREPKNLSMVALLFGELIQSGLFSYDQYIQRIIARGEPGLSFNGVSLPVSSRRAPLTAFCRSQVLVTGCICGSFLCTDQTQPW